MWQTMRTEAVAKLHPKYRETRSLEIHKQQQKKLYQGSNLEWAT